MDVGKSCVRKRLKGYTSVFLVIIVFSMIMTCLVMVEASAGLAARSIGENVCAVAGRSVLSEFQPDLYRRYGLFAIRDSQYFLHSKASFYINSSLEAARGLVRMKADRVSVDTSNYKIDNDALLEQIEKTSLGLNMYIINNFSNTVSSRDDTYWDSETEYIIFGRKSEESNRNEAKKAIRGLRFILDLAALYADEALIAKLEAEALLSAPEIPPEITVALWVSAQAYSMAQAETERILSGESVPIIDDFFGKKAGTYEEYLMIFLMGSTADKKLKRMKTVMEQNLNYVDKSDFSFNDYVLGFDLKVEFSKNASAQILGITKRKGSVFQSFKYQ